MNRQQLILAALFTGSGAALLVYILSGISLLATFLVTMLGAVMIGGLIWRRATGQRRKSLKTLLLGEEVRGPGIFLLGTLYHIMNGLTFSIAYTFAFARKGVWAGLIWALMLEVLMLTVYPGWLHIDQIGQFVGMSIFGHVFYGLVLGYTAQKLIMRDEG